MARRVRLGLVAAVVALGGVVLPMDAAVQTSPWGIYTLNVNTRSTFGQGGRDKAEVQISIGTLSGACLGQNGHEKGLAFGDFTKPIKKLARAQVTRFTGTVQYLDGTNTLGNAAGTMRIQRMRNGKFRASGNYRSLVGGRGREFSSFIGYQTIGLPF